MGDNDYVLAPLKFHDDRLQTDHNVTVALTSTVTVVVLVIISSFEVFWILFLDLLICKPIAYTGIKFVQCLPLELIISFWRCRKEARRLDGAFESRRPYCQLAIITDRLRNQFREFPRVKLAALGDVCITADFTLKVKL